MQKITSDNFSNPYGISILHLSVCRFLTGTVLEIVQTQDVFHLGFYPENSHLDIDVCGFRDYKDIYYEIRDRLNELNIDPIIRYCILQCIVINSENIQDNIKFFGVPHVFD